MGVPFCIKGERNMAKTKKPLSETKKAYNKELRRLKSFVSREEKKGFQFSSTAIPTRPKKITKASVNRLAKITTESLYKKAIYGGEATGGDIVSGEAGRIAEMKYRRELRREQRRQKQEKPQAPMPTVGFTVPDKVNTDKMSFSYIVIRNYRDMLKTYPKVAYPILSQWLDSLIAEHGEWDTALMIDEGLRNGLVLTKEIAYDENKLQDYMADMENYLGLDTERRKQLTDALESDENFIVY